MRKNLLILKLLVFTALLQCMPHAYAKTSHYKLDNGLNVLIKEDHRAPVVVSMVWYNVGSADEPMGLSGISHALEHMMFKGTVKHPPGEFSTIITRLGGQENAFTNYDYTAYYETVSAKHLPVCLELEADRMQNLLMDANAFSKEIEVVKEERRLRTDDNPQAIAFERFMATAHLSPPYQHPVVGWMNDLNQLQLDELQQWYKHFYAPNNATLVIVGDVNPTETLKAVKKYFERIPLVAMPKTKNITEPKAIGTKRVAVETHAQTPLLIMGYGVPSLNTSDNPKDIYTLELIAAILGAGDNARLPKILVRDKETASSVSVSYNLYSKYPTQFMLYAIPNHNVNLKTLEDALQNEIWDLQKTPVSTTELQRIKTQIVAEKTFEKDNLFEQAMELGILQSVGIGWEKSELYTKNINAITAQDVQNVAKKYLTKNNLTIAELKPQNESTP